MTVAKANVIKGSMSDLDIASVGINAHKAAHNASKGSEAAMLVPGNEKYAATADKAPHIKMPVDADIFCFVGAVFLEFISAFTCYMDLST